MSCGLAPTADIRQLGNRHHMQPGLGHYGVFSGKSWESQIFPILKNVILASG
jgi:poly-beta-hydroxyalkanoate depolymerase